MPLSIHEALDNADPIAVNPDGTLGSPEHDALLKDLQSNILTSHGLDAAHFFLVRFHENEDAIVVTKYLIGMLARSGFERAMIRSALQNPATVATMSLALQEVAATWSANAPAQITEAQHDAIKDVRMISEHETYIEAVRGGSRSEARALVAEGAQPVRFSVNVLLTASGYSRLGFVPPPDVAFNAGMASRDLHDPSPSDWHRGYHEGTEPAVIDALLIVAHDAKPAGAAQPQLAALREILGAHATIVREEEARTLRAQDEEGCPTYSIEPFGFRESVSQPVFYRAQLDALVNPGSPTRWNPFAPLRLALAPDPHGKTAHACGSYVVFRKLEQDVAGFYEQAEAIAQATGISAPEVCAQIVGRAPDGTPLTSAAGAAHENDFDYLGDLDALKCPFHAHTRKANPRTDVRESYGPKEHRIVRRGMSYGPSIDRDPSGKPTAQGLTEARDASLGLLFMCAQSEIATHFEHIQARWMNEPSHPRAKPSGIDTLSGQASDGRGFRVPFEDRLERPGERKMLDYRSIVTLRGGAYFFAPSIGFLRGLLGDLLKL